MKRRGNLAVNSTTTGFSVYSPLCTLVSNNATGCASAYLAVPWAASLALIALAELALWSALMVVGTSAFVAFTIALTVSATSLWLVRLFGRG